MRVLFVTLSIGLVCAAISRNIGEATAETVEKEGSDAIPLNHIWALQMPGTQDIRKLDPEDAKRIRVWLTERTAERAEAGPCFFVEGEGKEALANAAKALVDDEPRLTSIPAGKNVSLVFYAYAAPGYVHVKSVHHSDEDVTVKYRVVTHETSNATVHFAIIPLGKLSPGKFTVNAVEVRDDDDPNPYPEVKDRAICDSCSIVVH